MSCKKLNLSKIVIKTDFGCKFCILQIIWRRAFLLKNILICIECHTSNLSKNRAIWTELLPGIMPSHLNTSSGVTWTPRCFLACSHGPLPKETLGSGPWQQLSQNVAGSWGSQWNFSIDLAINLSLSWNSCKWINMERWSTCTPLF